MFVSIRSKQKNRTHSGYTKQKELTGRKCLQRVERAEEVEGGRWDYQRFRSFSGWKAEGWAGFSLTNKGCPVGLLDFWRLYSLWGAKRQYFHWCCRNPIVTPTKVVFYDMRKLWHNVRWKKAIYVMIITAIFWMITTCRHFIYMISFNKIIILTETLRGKYHYLHFRGGDFKKG